MSGMISHAVALFSSDATVIPGSLWCMAGMALNICVARESVTPKNSIPFSKLHEV